MDNEVYNKILQDVRSIEGLNACMNCGICTAICPAAEFYDYDPRSILFTVQSGNPEKVEKLLESEEIWYCGQCLSCKTRCPRGNCPGMIISVLRYYSQLTGAFTKSKKGRQQYLLRNSIAKNIFKYGYCLHPSEVKPDEFPEQGPVWKWVYNNQEKVYERMGANLDKEGAGTLRKIPDDILNELNEIFAVSGGSLLLDKIEEYSMQKAVELGFLNVDGTPDMDKYTEYISED